MAKPPDEELQKRALDFVTSTSTKFDSMVSSRRAKWLDWYKMYRLFRTEKKQPWQSKLFIPKVYEIVEKMVPALTANDPRYIIVPRFNDNIPFVPLLRDYLNYVWDEQDMNRKMELFAKGGLIYGTYVGKVGWRQVAGTERKVDTELNKATGDVEEVEVEEEVVRFEHPTFELVDIFNFKTDPFVQDLDESVANIHVIDDMPFGDLLADEDMFFNLDKINPLRVPDRDNDTSEGREKLESLGLNRDNEDDTEINLKECWCRFSPTGEVEDEAEYVITVVNDEIVIRLEKNEMGIRPFVAFKDKEVPGEFYGIGEVEPLEDLQIELNTLRNQRMDFTNTILNPEWLITPSSGVNPSQLVHKPNNVIITDEIGGVQMLQMRGVPIAGYNEEAQILRDFQTVSQTTDATDLGGARGFNNTATGVAVRDRQQKAVVGTIAKHFEAAIASIGKKFLVLAKNNLDSPVAIRRPDVTQESKVRFTELEPEMFEDVEEGFVIKVEAGSTLEHTAIDKANNAVALGNTSVQYAQAGVPIDLTKVYSNILKDSFFKNNPEDFLQRPEAPPPGSQLPETPVEEPSGASFLGAPAPGGAATGSFSPENTQLQPTLPTSVA